MCTEQTIQQLCAARGWVRQKDFAQAAGISQPYASQLWTGKRLVGRKMAKRLAPIFHVAPEVLILLERPDVLPPCVGARDLQVLEECQPPAREES
jgi:transcriptional regulator with XRE-family HTH domain